ncbi:MAG TPA: condensation domain-containing protein, partial [Ktedonobacteraceae bacterium]|nr:condensation domain-containing protein [Ktedonobacteraceae bacterium]
MNRKNIEALYPLSPMQQGMLFHTLYAPEKGMYFEQFSCLLHTTLDLPLFRQAWQWALDRHAVLRTSIHTKNTAKPLQMVHSQVELPWEVLDYRSFSTDEQREQLDALLQADRARGFQLAKAPLL